MPPNRSTAAVTAAAASSGLVTSSLTTSRSSALPTALVTVSVLRPVATTAFPAARAALARSTPIPRPAPVINQTFLSVIEPPPVGWLKTRESMHTGLLGVCLAGLMSSHRESLLGTQAVMNKHDGIVHQSCPPIKNLSFSHCSPSFFLLPGHRVAAGKPPPT